MAQHTELIPHNPDAERAIIGACLFSKEALHEALALLKPDAFYGEPNRILFQTISDMVEYEDAPVDELTLTNHLRRLKRLELVGGAATVSDYASIVPDVTNVPYYAEIVSDAAKLREMMGVGRRLEVLGNVYGCDVDSTIEVAVNDLLNIRSEERKPQETFGSIVERSIAISDGAIAHHLFPLGIAGLDDFLVIEPPHMLLLAGSLSSGKTSFALQIAMDAARRGKRGIVFSYEMTTSRLRTRILAAECGIPVTRIQLGKLTMAERERLTSTAQWLDTLPIDFMAASGMNIRAITAAARGIRARRGLDYMVIDYLQLIAPQPGRRSREEEVNSIGRGIKELADSMGIVAVLLAQLNNNPIHEKRRPRSQDIRESSAPAMHADSEIAVHIVDDKEDEPFRKVELLVLKQRDGPTGICEVGFNKQRMRFA